MYLASLSWSKAAKIGSGSGGEIVAVLPMGSLEEHGPVGPLGTDHIIPHEIAERIEKRIPDRALILPTLPYGVTPALAGFPGSVDIGYEALCAVLKGCVDAVLRCGVKRFLFLNGHGGNTAGIDTAALYLYHKGGQAAEIDWWVLCGQLRQEWLCGHGGGVETAVAMAIKPDWVHMEDLFESQVIHMSPRLKNTHIHNVEFEGASVKMMRDAADSIPSGDAGYGDSPSRASAALGADILNAVTDYTVKFIEEFSKIDLSAGRKQRNNG
ncbi:MAG: creatininase family protein [Synergistaceae bacterium]|nr:creatininase family protein [Synergistaceae bacterium]